MRAGSADSLRSQTRQTQVRCRHRAHRAWHLQRSPDPENQRSLSPRHRVLEAPSVEAPRHALRTPEAPRARNARRLRGASGIRRLGLFRCGGALVWVYETVHLLSRVKCPQSKASDNGCDCNASTGSKKKRIVSRWRRVVFSKKTPSFSEWLEAQVPRGAQHQLRGVSERPAQHRRKAPCREGAHFAAKKTCTVMRDGKFDQLACQMRVAPENRSKVGREILQWEADFKFEFDHNR